MMKISIKLFSLFVLGLNMAISACTKLSNLESTITTDTTFVLTNNPHRSVSNNYIRTFYDRTEGQPETYVRKELGKLNAIKKAYQLTEFRFMPLNTIDFNIGQYIPGVEYKGVPYSSTKETGTYVGNCISLYTFITAIFNSRSKLYSVRIDESPYHGINCKAYYGTACSSLVSYALGLKLPLGSFDFVDSELIEDIEYETPENVDIGDILWTKSHVAIITDILYSANGDVEMLEICEAIQSGCVRNQFDRSSFDDKMHNSYEKVLRYKYIENNLDYEPHPDIVPVAEEKPESFFYDNRICVDKGDCSNYLFDEDVTINVFHPYDSIVVYKDNERFIRFVNNEFQGDITLRELPYGSYNATLYYQQRTGTSKWIVVDYDVKYNLGAQEIIFRSHNALPSIVRLCDQNGSRGYSANVLLYRGIAEEEVLNGKLSIPMDKYLDDDHSYVQIWFNTEFGIISTLPIKATLH